MSIYTVLKNFILWLKEFLRTIDSQSLPRYIFKSVPSWIYFWHYCISCPFVSRNFVEMILRLVFKIMIKIMRYNVKKCLLNCMCRGNWTESYQYNAFCLNMINAYTCLFQTTSFQSTECTKNACSKETCI